jgi:YceI-like domain
MMKKAGFLTIGFVLLSMMLLRAQEKYYTKTGKVSFFSSTAVEDINAVNKSVVCLLNAMSGEIQFAVLVKGFEFKKALMQEHFNAEYLESDKFPKAEFKGQITNNGGINYKTNGTYPASVKGKLTIHGVTKDVESSGNITVKDGKLQAGATFNVMIDDYQITVPRLYKDNISKTIKVTVDCSLDPMK